MVTTAILIGTVVAGYVFGKVISARIDKAYKESSSNQQQS